VPLFKLGAVYKGRPHSRGVCPLRTFFWHGSSSDADVCTFWC